MGKKVIRFGLSPNEIDKAIQELDQYKMSALKKMEILRKTIAKKLAQDIQGRFNRAISDDLLSGDQKTAQVKIICENKENISVIIANGKEAVWVEFGAGVYHNGSVGTSPNPNGAKLGFTIGGYGKGNGEKEVWGFYKDGELRLTHGTPAAMPMYIAVKNICNEIAVIAREIFR